MNKYAGEGNIGHIIRCLGRDNIYMHAILQDLKTYEFIPKDSKREIKKYDQK